MEQKPGQDKPLTNVPASELLARAIHTPAVRAAVYIRELSRRLKRNRTIPISDTDITEEGSYRWAQETDAIGQEDVNRYIIDVSLVSGALYEIPIDYHFGNIVKKIDELLVKGKEGRFPPGWRNIDVRTGKYIPPSHKNVAGLMEAFANKVTTLEREVKPEDMDAFVAWTIWIVLNIHPKADGNGRFSKAIGSFLWRGKKILGWKSTLWKEAFLTTEQELMEKISQRTSMPIPDVGDIPANQQEANQWWNQHGQMLRNFYRHNNHDWVADILSEAIRDSSIDDAGKFSPSGPSPKALSLMTEFVAGAPTLTSQ